MTEEFVELVLSKGRQGGEALGRAYQDFAGKHLKDYPLGEVEFRHGHFDFMPILNPRTGKLFPVLFDYGINPNLSALKRHDPAAYRRVIANLAELKKHEFEALGLPEEIKKGEHKKLGIA